MAYITERFHCGAQFTETSIECEGALATPRDVERLLLAAGNNLNAAQNTTKLLRAAQLLNANGVTEIGWARYTLDAGRPACGFEAFDGNTDDPSYAYCGHPAGHAGEHGDYQF